MEDMLTLEYLAPKLRIVRRMSLEEDIKLLSSQASSIEAFVSASRGTRLATRLPSQPSLADIERAAWSYFSDILIKLVDAQYIVPNIYGAYALVYLGGMITRMLSELLEGRELAREEYGKHPLLETVVRVSSEYGIRGLASLFEKHGLNLLARTLRAPRPEKKIVELAVDIELVRKFREALAEVGDEPGREHVCHRLDAFSVRAAANAALLGIRDVQKMVTENIATCYVDVYKLVEGVEEGSIDLVSQAIHMSIYSAYTSSKLPLTEAMYHSTRRLSRQKLARNLATDPASRGHVASVLELLLLDVEDIVVLATAAYAGLPRDLVTELVSITG